MLRTLSIVVAIALADSINLSTIGPALVLAAGEHPRRRVLDFTLGILVVFFLGGSLLVLGPGQALLALLPRPSPTARYIVETVVGFGLILGALFWRRLRSRSAVTRQRARSSPQTATKAKRRKHTAHSSEAAAARLEKAPFEAGAAIAAVELLSAAPYWAAIATIISARLHPWQELLLVAVYDVCFVLPLFGIVLVLTVGGARATEILDRIRDRIQAHGQKIARGLALIAGIYVAVLGVTGLASAAPGRSGRVARHLRHAVRPP
jgi:cytochrome c biogenesis protein CcdA